MYYNDYKSKKIWHDGWYLREENNGWRPVRRREQKLFKKSVRIKIYLRIIFILFLQSLNNFYYIQLDIKLSKKKDPVESSTSQKVKYFHHNKDYRSKKKEK